MSLYVILRQPRTDVQQNQSTNSGGLKKSKQCIQCIYSYAYRHLPKIMQKAIFAKKLKNNNHHLFFPKDLLGKKTKQKNFWQNLT